LHRHDFFGANIMAAIDDLPPIAEHHAKVKAATRILCRAKPQLGPWLKRSARQQIGPPILPPGLDREKGMRREFRLVQNAHWLRLRERREAGQDQKRKGKE
jgi:hypothetical protein